MKRSVEPTSELGPVRAYAGLGVLVVHVLVAPYVLNDPGSWAAVVLHLVLHGLLFVILIGLIGKRWQAVWCVGLIVLATGVRMVVPVENVWWQGVADAALVLCGVVVMVLGLRRLVASRRVTGALISGAVSLYLLSGVVWALVFHAMEVAWPGSFSMGAGVGERSVTAGDLYYFSFVTLTTLGYGDVSPATAVARSLAVVEAVFGQVYLIVWLGRLVSLQVSSVFAQRGVA
ncbi:MAG: ion channel [Planctomycetota bacterium]